MAPYAGVSGLQCWGACAHAHRAPLSHTLPRTLLLLYKPNGVSANGSRKVYYSLCFSSVGAPTGANGRQRIAENTYNPPCISSVGAPTGANGRQRIAKDVHYSPCISSVGAPTAVNGCQQAPTDRYGACIIHPTYRSLVADGCQRAPVNRKKRSLSTSQLVRWHAKICVVHF